ncbi:Neuropeptide FF receptor 2 [Trichoplax sp. H2]|nr:Neuropeptide FF receptor 2 [Trichoplax sp. H2]|eukprot:RDD39732.1 Neuropeptide FF receptor 2 [Trichoplax sp. H2]
MTISNTTTYSFQIANIYASVIITIAAVGLIANTLIIYIFISDKYFRKITYNLMLICAISDAVSNISGLISNGMLLGISMNQSYTMGTVCKISGIIINISYGVSIFNLCLISIDRYFVIVRPLNNFYRTNKKKIVIISEIFIWLLSGSIAIPDTVYLQSQDENEYTSMCDYPNMTVSVGVYLVSFSVFYYILPSMAIIIIYWRIILFQRNYIRPGQQLQQMQHTTSNKYKLVKSLISISSFYVSATFPFFLVLFVCGVTRTPMLQIQRSNPGLFTVCMLSLTTANNITVLSPFLYLKFDGNIRKRFHEILKNLHGTNKRGS